ncbi:hypothetical protein [Lysobacter tyrosinilyticus]
MIFHFDLKAIGLGALAFIAGYIAFVLVAAAIVGASGSPAGWLGLPLILLGAFLPAALAGFAGSYFAKTRFVFHGLLAGCICVVVAFYRTVVSSPHGGSKGLLVALLAVWLGTIVGSFVRRRRGP